MPPRASNKLENLTSNGDRLALSMLQDRQLQLDAEMGDALKTVRLKKLTGPMNMTSTDGRTGLSSWAVEKIVEATGNHDDKENDVLSSCKSQRAKNIPSANQNAYSGVKGPGR